MRFSSLPFKTSKQAPHDADSVNAQLLSRAGFVHQEMAGVYSYLPLGLRTLRRIEQIVREEMQAAGGQEILMPAMTPKENWVKTGRWGHFDALFRFEGMGDKEYALGATHEEIVTPLVQEYAFSYKDLPAAVFQIQTKFRNEPRAKSGLLRGREFSMKDLYSFHTTQEDLDRYYEEMKAVYFRVFERLGFAREATYLTYASGGAFCKYSHEFQVLSDAGEDTLFACTKCRVAVNREIVTEQNTCPECGNKKLEEKRGIEVGNIFKLGTRFSDAFGFKVALQGGGRAPVAMGCYGIGPSRIMGTLVEVSHDEKGMVWPKAVAPFAVHLASLGKDAAVTEAAEKLYKELKADGVEVLFDDRDEGAGVKLNDADLMGMPLRLVISARTLQNQSAEWKARAEKEAQTVPLKDLLPALERFFS